MATLTSEEECAATCLASLGVAQHSKFDFELVPMFGFSQEADNVDSVAPRADDIRNANFAQGDDNNQHAGVTQAIDDIPDAGDAQEADDIQYADDAQNANDIAFDESESLEIALGDVSDDVDDDSELREQGDSQGKNQGDSENDSQGDSESDSQGESQSKSQDNSQEKEQRAEAAQFVETILASCASKTPNQCVALFETHAAIRERLFKISAIYRDLCCFRRLLRSFYPYVPAPYNERRGAKALALIADLCDWQKPLRNTWLNNALNKALESRAMLVYADWDESDKGKRSHNYFWHCFDGSWTLTLFEDKVHVKLDNSFLGDQCAPGTDCVVHTDFDAICVLKHGFKSNYSVVGDAYVSDDNQRILSLIIRCEDEPHKMQCWSIDIDRLLREQQQDLADARSVSASASNGQARPFPVAFDMFTRAVTDTLLKEQATKSSNERSLRKEVIRCAHIRLRRLHDDSDRGSVAAGRYFVQSINDRCVAFVDLARGSVAYQRYDECVKIDGAPQTARGKFYSASARVMRRANGRKRRANGARSTFYPFFQ